MKLMKVFFISGVILSILLLWHFSPLTLQAKEVSLEKQLISLDFDNADLEDVLRSISAKCGINIMVDPDVKGKVTARFEKPIPLLKALSLILSPHGFDYTLEDGIIRVKKPPVEFLSGDGKINVDTKANSILVIDHKKIVERIEAAIKDIDTISRQLRKKTFTLRYALAEDVARIIKDHLTENGALQVEKKTNSLIVEDSFSSTQEVFKLQYALAEEAFPLVKDCLSDKGKAELIKDKNEIFVVDAPYPLSKVENFIKKIDVFSLQVKEKTFKANYLYTKELVALIEPYLSPQGKIKVNLEKEEVVVKDASYPLYLMQQEAQKKDIFSPQREVFKLQFTSAKTLAHKAQELLSPQGKIEVDEEANNLLVVDARKFLDKVAYLVKKEDRIEN